MNYSEMTDIEINKEVAKHFTHSVYINAFNEPVRLEADPASAYTGRDFDEVPFDPCNSWLDAGPIIQENGICLGYDGVSWDASCPLQGIGNISHWRKHPESPLRMAMIVFLMMQEEK